MRFPCFLALLLFSCTAFSYYMEDINYSFGSSGDVLGCQRQSPELDLVGKELALGFGGFGFAQLRLKNTDSEHCGPRIFTVSAKPGKSVSASPVLQFVNLSHGKEVTIPVAIMNWAKTSSLVEFSSEGSSALLKLRTLSGLGPCIEQQPTIQLTQGSIIAEKSSVQDLVAKLTNKDNQFCAPREFLVTAESTNSSIAYPVVREQSVLLQPGDSAQLLFGFRTAAAGSAQLKLSSGSASAHSNLQVQNAPKSCKREVFELRTDPSELLARGKGSHYIYVTITNNDAGSCGPTDYRISLFSVLKAKLHNSSKSLSVQPGDTQTTVFELASSGKEHGVIRITVDSGAESKAHVLHYKSS